MDLAGLDKKVKAVALNFYLFALFKGQDSHL